MNKKILIGSVLTILMLVTISFATAVTSNTNKDVENKESPLFRIRTKLAIGERIKNLAIIFLRQRIFFLPFQWLSHEILSIRDRLNCKQTQNPAVCTEAVRCTFMVPECWK